MSDDLRTPVSSQRPRLAPGASWTDTPTQVMAVHRPTPNPPPEVLRFLAAVRPRRLERFLLHPLVWPVLGRFVWDWVTRRPPHPQAP